MNGFKMYINGKDLMRAGVCVGAGLMVGKYLGGLINAGLDGVAEWAMGNMANRGDETAQKICEKYDIKYDKPKDDNSSEKVMGFHCE